MEFWIGLVLFCFICIVSERLLPKPIHRIVPYMLLVILWFISAFRYMIGWDYESYMTMFYSVEYGDVYPEITFIFFSELFRNFGFDYQIVFLLYSTVMFIFLYQALSYYNNNNVVLWGVILFTLIPNFYWDFFSVMRQGVAVVIFLWSSRYIVERQKYKYIFIVLFAMIWHFSAVFMLVTYWLVNIKMTKKKYIILIVVSIIISLTPIIPLCLDLILNFLGVYTGYLEADYGGAYELGLSRLYYTVIYIIMLWFFNFDKKENVIIFNVFTISIMSSWLFGFFAPFHRIQIYFFSYFVILFPLILESLKNSYKVFLKLTVLFFSIILFLYTIYLNQFTVESKLHPYDSAGNINYEFNFKLMQ